jgi:hypothetical protein
MDDDSIVKLRFKNDDLINSRDYRKINDIESDNSEKENHPDAQTLSLYRRLANMLYGWDERHDQHEH